MTVNQNLSGDEIVALNAQLEAEYEDARTARLDVIERRRVQAAQELLGVSVTDEVTDGEIAAVEDAFQSASAVLVEARQFWRSVGEVVNLGHPGRRTGVGISNNDGSVAS